VSTSIRIVMYVLYRTNNDEPIQYQRFDFGTTKFPNVPLFSREPSYERDGNIGYGKKRIDCTLTGFIEENDAYELQLLYAKLDEVFEHNDIRFTYKIEQESPAGSGVWNTTVVMDEEPVYIDKVSEPSGWKFYNGEYNIAFHYYKNDAYTNDLGIAAHYLQDAACITSPGAAALYLFEPAPSIGRNTNRKRDWNSSGKSKSGKKIGNEVMIDIKGFLSADNEEDLYAKMTEMEDALKVIKGTLTYGSFTKQVRLVSGPNFSPIFIRNHVDYTIRFAYNTENLYEITTDLKFSRMHKFTKVKNRLYCKTIKVKQYTGWSGEYISGQYIDYSIRIKGKDRETTRYMLKDELASIIFSGGYEMDGGSEHWLDDNFIEFNTKYFYKTAILPNVDYDAIVPSGWNMQC